jgi:RNA polymerase sigma factor (sigma-70 family)
MPNSSPPKRPRSDDQAPARQSTELERCFESMVKLGRSLIRRYGLQAVLDAEDAANAVLYQLYKSVSVGKLPQFETSDGFWRLARVLITRKVLDEKRRSGSVRRGGTGRARSESAGSAELVLGRGFVRADVELESLQSRGISPEDLVAGKLEAEHLIEKLEDPLLKTIVRLRLEGYTDQEIAEETGQDRSTVYRKLQRIRAIWKEPDLES